MKNRWLSQVVLPVGDPEEPVRGRDGPAACEDEAVRAVEPAEPYRIASHRSPFCPVSIKEKDEHELGEKQRITPDPDLLSSVIYASPARRSYPVPGVRTQSAEPREREERPEDEPAARSGPSVYSILRSSSSVLFDDRTSGDGFGCAPRAPAVAA